MSERPVLFLLDGHAIAYRQFHAFNHARGGAFVSPAGEPTGGTYGFTRLLLDILQTEKPKYLAVSFDRGLSGREDLYTEYKANRDAVPEDLVPQLKRMEQIVRAFNIPVLALDNYEADDVIGTIAKQAEAQDVQVRIITGDRDILQLLSPHVNVQLPQRRGPDIVYDTEAFIKKYEGLRPEQLVDLKALMGDSSDNIPGVKGVGQKTGTKLLLEYGTLDEIYAHIEDLKGAVKKKMIADKEMAYISQELARIQTDLPLTLSLAACLAKDYDPLAVDSIFEEIGFNSHRETLKVMHPTVDFNPPLEMQTVIVNTDEALAKLVETLNAPEVIVWDVETTSLDQMSAELVGIALAVDAQTGYYVPVGHKGKDAGTLFADEAGEQLPLDTVLEALRPALTNPEIPKVAHNALYDLVVMQRYGIDVSPIGFDTMIAEWVRDPISNNLGLKRFALAELNITMTEISQLIGKGKNALTMDAVAIEDAAPYAAADAIVTCKAYQYLKPILEEQGLDELFATLDMPTIPVIAAMQRHGALLNTDFLAALSVQLQSELARLEEEIYELGESGTFNINSPKQLNDVLFETLKLPVKDLKKTTHGFSTDVVTLDILKDEHDIIPKITEYRELSKLKSTYVDALPELVNEKTGRVHTSYNQTGTSTGRFSSSNPNLQNIPIRTEIGREVRRAFIAPEGYKLLAVDYSQIELRVLAHISEDKTLIAAFEQGQDIHRATAAAVYGVDPEDITYEQRSFAKRVNFGLLYGMGARRLAQDSDLTFAEAEKFVATYFERLPGVERYITGIKEFVEERGYTETLLGRKRTYPQLAAGKGGRRAAGEIRAAINMPIQGTAADILKLAMLKLYDALQTRKTAAKMILQVHDELVLEVPDRELEAITALVLDVMQSAYALRVPLVANAEVGQNWLEMEKVAL